MKRVFKVVPYNQKTSYDKYFYVEVDELCDISRLVSSLLNKDEDDFLCLNYLNHDLFNQVCEDNDFSAFSFHILKQPKDFKIIDGESLLFSTK